jgi:hypothetical protein
MPKSKRTPPQELLDVLERVDKLLPEWKVSRDSKRSRSLPRPGGPDNETSPIDLARISFESHGISVSISEQIQFLYLYGMWRGLHYVEARRFTVRVTAKAETASPIYECVFIDHGERYYDGKRITDTRDIAACDYLHEYIYRVATPVFQAEAKQQEDYEARKAAEERAKQDKVDEIKNKFWNT